LFDGFFSSVADELKAEAWQVSACAELLLHDAPVPFIARYRRDQTGGLDEAAASLVRHRLADLAETEARRSSLRKSLEARGLLTPEIASLIARASSPGELDDIGLPFRPRRKTRGATALELGLAPLAEALWGQDPALDPRSAAGSLMETDRRAACLGVDGALQGARDILAERVAESAPARRALRALFADEAVVTARAAPGMAERAARYRECLERQDLLARIPWHRYLLCRRGEADGTLILTVTPDPAKAMALLASLCVRNASPAGREVEEAARDACLRILFPALEAEAKLAAKKRADREAIAVFAGNLRGLLLAPRWGRRPVLAIEPGSVGDCRAAALSGQGELLEHRVFSLRGGDREREKAAETVLELALRHGATAVAVAAGEGDRECELFIRRIPGLPEDVPVILASSSGAALYSASPEARAELPGVDGAVKAAVFTGRRLMDPLAALARLDPRSVCVGQFQSDVDQLTLKVSLDETVTSCVAAAGADLNSASERLLAFVPAVGPAVAKAIVAWRARYGPFRTRRDLLKVPRMSPRIFERCAGFLLVEGGPEPLDATFVHPECYAAAEAMASGLGVTVADLTRDESLRARVDPGRFASAAGGPLAAAYALAALGPEGRDPRKPLLPFCFDPEVRRMEDLSPGMRIPGIVTNVTPFGAFVNIGLRQEGLLHLSELSDEFVAAPSDVVKVGQELTVTVLKVEQQRGRIRLTLRQGKPEEPGGLREGAPPSSTQPPLSPDPGRLSVGRPAARPFRGRPAAAAGRGALAGGQALSEDV
jgi:uncharacterized protein